MSRSSAGLPDGLPDWLRHGLATLAAVLAFLGLYLGLSLMTWAALGLAAAVYGALLLVLPARRDLSRVFIAPRVSEADLRAARAALSAAETRLTALAAEADPQADRDLLLAFAAKIGELDRVLASDPGDVVILRRFIGVHLPRMVESVESYQRLRRSASDAAIAERLQALREVLETYPDKVGALTRAALGNDLLALEVEVDVLARQLNRE